MERTGFIKRILRAKPSQIAQNVSMTIAFVTLTAATYAVFSDTVGNTLKFTPDYISITEKLSKEIEENRTLYIELKEKYNDITNISEDSISQIQINDLKSDNENLRSGLNRLEQVISLKPGDAAGIIVLQQKLLDYEENSDQRLVLFREELDRLIGIITWVIGGVTMSFIALFFSLYFKRDR